MITNCEKCKDGKKSLQWGVRIEIPDFKLSVRGSFSKALTLMLIQNDKCHLARRQTMGRALQTPDPRVQSSEIQRACPCLEQSEISVNGSFQVYHPKKWYLESNKDGTAAAGQYSLHVLSVFTSC